MKRAVWVVLLAVLAFTGCRRITDTTRTIQRVRNKVGWFLVVPGYHVDEKTREVFPDQYELDPSLEGDERKEAIQNAILEAYDGQVKGVYLDATSPCEDVLANSEKGPLVIIVPGIQGDSLEWVPVLAQLKTIRPSGVFMYRWGYTEQTPWVISKLVEGTNHLVECYPNAKQVIVFAHSAGGVITSMGIDQFKVPKDRDFHVLTVASPLAGVAMIGGKRAELVSGRVAFDLGTAIEKYPDAAPGVNVTHYRTQYPADEVMKPNDEGRAPNLETVKVPQAKVVNLPETLTHDGSLTWVGEQLVLGKLLPLR